MCSAVTEKVSQQITAVLAFLADRVASKPEGRLLLKQGEQLLSHVKHAILCYDNSERQDNYALHWAIATPVTATIKILNAGTTLLHRQTMEHHDMEDAPKSYIETVLWWPITMITKIGRLAGLGLSPIHTEESNQSEPLPDDEREPPSEETETQPPSENKDSDTSFTTVASDTKPNDTSDHDDFHSTSSLRATDSPTEIDPLPCSQATDGEAIIPQTIETIEDVSTLATVVPSVVVPSLENAVEQKKPKKGGFASLFKKKDRNS